MDKGDWIYILFAAVAAIISIYKRSIKKREAEESSAGPLIPEEYEEETDDWLPETGYRQPEPVRPPVTRPAPAAYTPIRTEPAIMPVQEDEPAGLQIGVDEIRQGIIYSEILNRKY
ncbi:MAG: hypothetical protein LBC81_03785 [Tannerellaceae bacterium]|jgi:hypothetical protein|nr:hypothetical protein [Tannerellaceae bacterium]